jgi:hypothetical protein
MITMQAQGLASTPEVQLMDKEDLEDIEHEFPRGEILGLDMPSLGPAIDVQELILEGGRRRVDCLRRHRFCFPAHMLARYDLAIAERALEVTYKRIDPDAFDRPIVSMQRIKLAAALRVAEVLPVRSLVTGASKARLLDEGFEQDRPIGIAGMPVLGQSLSGQGEDARGEVFAADPRQDEEAGIIDDQVQVALSLLRRPANELISRFYFPSARAKAEGGDDMACGAHKVA